MASSSRVPPQRNLITERTKVESDVLEKLAGLNLQPGDTTLPEKLPPGTYGKRFTVKSNIYQVKIEPSVIYRYDVNVVGKSRSGKEIEFTKRSQESVVIADRRQECRACFRLAYRKYQEFFGSSRETLYYDLQSILFSKNELPIPDSQIDLELDSVEDADPTFPKGISRVLLSIKKAKSHEIDMKNLDSIHDPETGKRDRSLLNIIELIANQLPMFNENEFLTLHGSTSYIINGADHQLPEIPLDEGGTKYLAAGVKKSAVYIEGYDTGKMARECKSVGLMVETRRSPFHTCKALVDYIRDHPGFRRYYENFIHGQSSENDLRSMTKFLRPITFGTSYNKRKMKISLFSQQTARTQSAENMSIYEYFMQKYDMKLEYPDAHLVGVKHGGALIYFPPEVLIVADNQLVSVQQMDMRTKARMVEMTAVRPDVFQRESQAGAAAIRLHDSPFTTEAGIKFSRGVLQIPARKLPFPSMEYKDLKTNRPKLSSPFGQEAAWMQMPFLRGARIPKYSAYLIGTESDSNMPVSKEDLARFFEYVEEWAKRFGMCIGAIDEFDWIFESDVDRKVGENAQRNTKLVYFISPEHIKHSHVTMKHAEHKYDCVVTQDIRVPTVKKVLDKAVATLENLIAKTNMKLGGSNYSVKLGVPEAQKQLEENLFIGISISQPGAKTQVDQMSRNNRDVAPGVLGFAANLCEDPDNFAGDFVYIDAYRNDDFVRLRDVTSRCVSRFIENRRHPPKTVVFYYSGASDGQYDNILRLGSPFIKYGIKQACDVDVPLCLICVSKDNNFSIFPNEFPQPSNRVTNGDYNVPAGTVIDERAVHPLYTQFFLVAHTAIKGTARVPRYTVLMNEPDFSLDILEAMSYALCHEHQIVGRATALPTPTVVAEDYANRGQQVFKAAEKEAERGQYFFPRSPDGSYDLHKLSGDLSYEQCQYLRSRRVNA
ncbi:unnamed protein product [Bursaphelenchus xylophilus]|uniref:(pine wood nematode) hypothetical protein n=1 Tax=Bursaphelenchus xylophilus TaxID=6326 RepID=A0A1I7RX38_BURXY|nr:unnamed protein product [Bursaphelenchus xylophilus]CAG9121301.1 unnamed protein product [Bursaphelenchus xylophilus]